MSSTMVQRTAARATEVGSGEQAGALDTLRRGFALSPQLKEGLGGTLALALFSTAGGAVVPVVVQRAVDRGLSENSVDGGSIVVTCLIAAAVVLATSVAAYLMKVRMFVASERGLAELRIRAFRHVHDLPVLTQSSERRGALVSRVTSDIDQVSMFLQFGGILIVVSAGQILIATGLMLFYSWELTVVVWVCFLPLVLALRLITWRMTAAYGRVRRSVGEMLSVVAEPVVGATVVRAHAIEARTQARVDAAIQANYRRQVEAQRLVAVTFASAGVAGGLASAGVVVVGVWLGVAGHMTIGTVVAFAFLVSLLVGPVTMATQVLTEAQNAVASWRRVIGLLETPADVADPGPGGTPLPDGPLPVRFERVSFAYPDGPVVLRDIDVELGARLRVAVVGETGSGKTTFAKLLTRLMDPASGRVLVGGVDLRTVPFESLRRRVVMVPQEGFLFDATLAENLRYGRPGAGDDELVQAVRELGLGEWLDTLPDGLGTAVGQRGESLSAGERQLVALVRASLADPDLLVLDEATSAVDPQTESMLARALDGLLRDRSSVTVAHRMSTAEAADEVLVFDDGELVERGPHQRLVDAGGVYSRLHTSWVAQSRLGQEVR
ncbi:MAG TPA: ABC transporter ATP-binding protein [Nocardioidaceae bacterium]|jgi:ABC-type multidrug transport system fused ATPase/permease subunit|nr:ABC transporter ATP-binding protein [Nocardioidaceae bacterium]